MDGNSGVLVRVGSALSRDGVLLLVHGPPGEDHAVLEDDGGVAEDEVYGAVDVAFFVELPLGMDIESVLVAFEATAIEDREVSA